MHDIPAKFLKLSCTYLSKLLCKLFNMCFISGIYPKIFKLSRIAPDYKKGTRNLISNYRPINGLCNLNKLFESLLVKILGKYFNSGGLLAANQFGFRKQKNTELAVFSLIERALPAIENKILQFVYSWIIQRVSTLIVEIYFLTSCQHMVFVGRVCN